MRGVGCYAPPLLVCLTVLVRRVNIGDAALHLIDECILSVHPVLLGDGIPLFERPQPREILHLREERAFESGLVQLRYAVD
jgi:dihydrofolate reductase